MGEQSEKPGNRLELVVGEIESDLTKTSPGLVLPADVIVEDEVCEMGNESTVIRDDVRASASIGRMNEKEREAVKSTIKRALLNMKVGVLQEIVDILGECMPAGIREPELCGGDSSRGICCWVEKSISDPKMIIDFRFRGMDCKISVEEDGVKMYVSIGPKFMLYCK